MKTKRRLTASRDALRLKLEHDRRLRALTAFVASYKAEHGEISDAAILAAKRRIRGRAVGGRGA
ncbi:MAG: hypothetical protein HY904_08015 [Deltaproteobacteria bacterium]|nr:hypothetical protein [Deltaproteobacteria bacterium]